MGDLLFAEMSMLGTSKVALGMLNWSSTTVS